MRENSANRISVAGLKSHQRGVRDALIFAGKFFADQPFQLLDIEMENFRDQAEDENVFALVLRRSA